jgi:hypothetical protein
VKKALPGRFTLLLFRGCSLAYSTLKEKRPVFKDQPANGAAALRAFAPSLRRSTRDRLSGRLAIALVGGTSLVLWVGLMSLAVHLFR